MSHPRLYLALAFSAAAACALWQSGAAAQNPTLRPLAHTPRGHVSLNPTLSGDGRRVAFETTAGPGEGAPTALRAVYADTDAATLPPRAFAASRAPAPAVSQDGALIAFTSKDDPLGRNPDRNPEVFLFDGAALAQLTDTRPDDSGRRASEGSFQPSISDDGRRIAFASNRNLAERNPDASHEIFLYDSAAGAFRQLTDAGPGVAHRDAKLSGDGSRLAYVRTRAAADDSPPARSDLVLHDLRAGAEEVAAAGVVGLSLTYGRAVSDDGARVVYSALTERNSREVFLYDGRNGLNRQLTELGPRASDVLPHASISGDGSRVTFATRRNVGGSNPDGGVELYLYDLPTGRLSRLTDAPAAATAEVVSSLSDDGRLVAFSFPRLLADPSAPEEFANQQEVFVTSLEPRPPFADDLRVAHGAFPKRRAAEPSRVAPDSIAVALGERLALGSHEAVRRADKTFPQELGGTSVTVNGRPAQLFYASPGQVNFHIPEETETGPAQVVVRNPDGFERRGTVLVVRAAPGVFSASAEGGGEAVALDEATLRPAPFDVTDSQGDPRRLILFCTGLRGAGEVSLSVGRARVNVLAVVASPDLPGLDQVHLALPARLRGAGAARVSLTADGLAANSPTVAITADGPASRPARVTISPAEATAPVGGEYRFRAEAFDSNGEPIPEAQIIFSTSDAGVARIDADGMARADSPGEADVSAAAGGARASARLRVVARTFVINEILADPPDGSAGDANRDGLRSGSDDEFVELVNGSHAPLDLSGWTLRTRPLGAAAETTRHLFGPGASVPAGDALVIFGGGVPDPASPAFGGAQVTTASGGGLALSNAGLTVVVRDAEGNLVQELSYGAAGDGTGGDSVNQSLTRSPDLSGALERHASAGGSGGRRFSPGTLVDGSFFVARAGRLARVEMRPASLDVFVAGRRSSPRTPSISSAGPFRAHPWNSSPATRESPRSNRSLRTRPAARRP